MKKLALSNVNKFICLIALFGGGLQPSHGEPSNILWEGGINAFLATADNFYIRVHDQATDECLPHPSRLKDAMEIALRKSGFAIRNDEEALVNEIEINVLGYAHGTNACVLNIDTKLSQWMLARVPAAGLEDTFVRHRDAISQILLTGPKAGMQERSEQVVRDHADTLFLNISRARDEIFTKFPIIKNVFEARSK